MDVQHLVTFNNTSLLSESAQNAARRQTPFSFGTDTNLGGWNFERFKINSHYLLRVKSLIKIVLMDLRRVLVTLL